MELERFAAHDILDERRYNFSRKEYSWFKYGSKTIARKFGRDLADEFFKSKQFVQIVTELKDKQIVVCSSPYQFIPTATFAMKDYFVGQLNERLVDFGMNPIEETKINRVCSYITDYGTMQADEREKVISGDDFHIDREFVKGKLVIFLDDIKITGAHENRVRKLIDEYKLECDYLFMYYVELKANEITPTVEDELNLYAINNLVDISNIIRNQEFIFNTRVTKYILKAPKDDFINFVNYQSDQFKENLYRNAIGNGYHKSDSFIENLNYLKMILL